MSLYRPEGFAEDHVRFKLFRAGDAAAAVRSAADAREHGAARHQRAPLSPAAPGSEPGEVWIQDFEMSTADGHAISPGKVNQLFQDAFEHTWIGRVENDGFNRLILKAGLDWRQAALLRALCRYLLQTGLPFSQAYMEQVLASTR
jgi:glutamate dehydrogenase